MRKAMIGALLILSGFSGKAFSNQDDNKGQIWPDYSKWQVVQDAPFHAVVEKKNLPKYLSGLEINIGTLRARLDNIKAPTLVVVEVSILGNGVVIRSLVEITPVGDSPLDLQLLVNGKWMSGKPNSLKVYLSDPKKFLCKGELGEVVLTLDSPDGGPPLKLVLKALPIP